MNGKAVVSFLISIGNIVGVLYYIIKWPPMYIDFLGMMAHSYFVVKFWQYGLDELQKQKEHDDWLSEMDNA